MMKFCGASTMDGRPNAIVIGLTPMDLLALSLTNFIGISKEEMREMGFDVEMTIGIMIADNEDDLVKKLQEQTGPDGRKVTVVAGDDEDPPYAA